LGEIGAQGSVHRGVHVWLVLKNGVGKYLAVMVHLQCFLM
jgi:hypothetical protein